MPDDRAGGRRGGVDPSALLSVVRELRQTVGEAAQTQRQVLTVTGTATSPDGLITVVVGPRGQLVDLRIDPRVYRQPNAGALAATILATARAAVEQAVEKTAAIVDAKLPKVDQILPPGAERPFDVRQLLRQHDGDLKRALDAAGES
ncbi:YbaB/EbfC family nucleoid-associated protein [Actinoplanes oblitus]|uniref:YbaB/EbfC family nucleoid-associated protein n=1 Tax=Actinoplanes oblitus TaxID=3040509 RepID=A0ABY8WPW8_9ACTN|nr:YbaB/EbfC family nucleoid-associated protein [Actinoplanes oblitus]WIM99926.1 YbaB/EbfC family nucleoid-associated protein [Actinoplanes oblitus]